MAVADVTARPLDSLLSLAGKTAVVTGGARGIGLAISRRFAEAGAQVTLADLDEAEAVKAAGQLPGAVGVYLDAAASASHEAVAAQVIGLNLSGAFYGARAAARHMQGAGGGVILNLSSTAGLRPAGPGFVHYASSKAGVVGLGQHNIRVLGLAPTFVHTPGTQAQAAGLKAASGLTGDDIGARLPLGRAGQPDDVARVALFCASDLALFMTGSTLPVDGGALVS